MSEDSQTYSKGQVNAAGLILRETDPEWLWTNKMTNAIDILGAWRASHAHPLQVTYMALRERAKKKDSKAIISQRLKRVSSIVIKLRRHPNMKLSTIQDIGGYRAVVSDIAEAKALAQMYGTIVRDYISDPKNDGYRSIHIVETYKHQLQKHEQHSGRKIEVQVRTRLQHAWATAVETVDSLMGQNLKTGGGISEWKRFFALASSVIATKEACPAVPGTPCSQTELKDEIKDLSTKLDVFNRLDGLASSVENLSHIVKNRQERTAAFVLVTDLRKKTISPYGFLASQLEQATDFYLEKEKENYGDPSMQIVQVSVNQVKDLKKAYPNYYLNAQEFLKAIKQVI